jgi:hypothetical protein
MLLTVVLILFAMAALAALEITLFRRLAERDDRRDHDRQARRRRLGGTADSAPDPFTVPTRTVRPRFVGPPRARRHMSHAVRAHKPDRSHRDR